MSETIREMVLPGTYIEVRAEGLIGVSGISTGNLGVVGTAGDGPSGEIVLLGSYREAVEQFGAYPPWDSAPTADNPSLVRTLQQAFKGGASTVYAVRVASGGTGVAAGLELLAAEPVHIVCVGGLDAGEIADEVAAHVEATENDGRERIAVIGASSDDPSSISGLGNPRIVLVAPGIVADDAGGQSVALPAPYAAALVAGRLSTLAPHVSLTNKGVAAGGLTTRYTRAQQKALLDKQVLVLHQHLGFRVLKGVTTDTGPFRQISVRRIVDYAKAGVRIGANPYIGRLNNARVRAALQATLDGFLSGMVLDEMLQSYQLAVTATRSQEIAGQAIVTMVLRPTFSIDFVKVIMNLE
jgi:hypothetical protein